MSERLLARVADATRREEPNRRLVLLLIADRADDEGRLALADPATLASEAEAVKRILADPDYTPSADIDGARCWRVAAAIHSADEAA